MGFGFKPMSFFTVNDTKNQFQFDVIEIVEEHVVS